MIGDNIFIHAEYDQGNEVEEQDEGIDPEGGIVEEAGFVVFAHREAGEDQAGKNNTDRRDEQGGERVEIVPALDEKEIKDQEDLYRQGDPPQAAPLRHITTQHRREEIEIHGGQQQVVDVIDKMIPGQSKEKLIIHPQGLDEIGYNHHRQEYAQAKIVQPFAAQERHQKAEQLEILIIA